MVRLHLADIANFHQSLASLLSSRYHYLFSCLWKMAGLLGNVGRVRLSASLAKARIPVKSPDVYLQGTSGVMSDIAMQRSSILCIVWWDGVVGTVPWPRHRPIFFAGSSGGTLNELSCVGFEKTP